MPASKGRWWLTHDSHQTVISTTPDRIYDLVSDLPRMGEWSPECERVEWADGTTVAAEGARFVGHNRGGPFRLMRWSRHGRVIAADPGVEFAFVTEEGGRESTLWRYRFEPVEGGTRVTESYQVQWIPAWARMLDIPTNRHRELHEAMRYTLGQLKTTAEKHRTARGAKPALTLPGEPSFRPAQMTAVEVQRLEQPRKRSSDE